MADKALLVGINKYANFSDLYGCVNDVADIQNLLEGQFGFRQFRTITNERAIKPNIMAELDWLLEDVSPGDRIVFHFSGHGSQVQDISNDEGDGVDEILCCHDMDFNNESTFIVDDELFDWSLRIPKDVSCTVILDSCHSGSGTRVLTPGGRFISWNNAGAKAEFPLVNETAITDEMPAVLRSAFDRSIDDETNEVSELIDEHTRKYRVRFLRPPNLVNENRAISGKRFGHRAASSTLTLFSACEDSQTAADTRIDGLSCGAFTYYFCRAIRAISRNPTVRQIIDRVRENLSSNRYDQTPQLEPSNNSGSFLGRFMGSSNTSMGASESGEQQQLAHLLAQLASWIERNTGHSSRSSESKKLVYVHGICRHEKGYSDPWWNALRPHVSKFAEGRLGEERLEVLWSDLVNTRSTTRETESFSNSLQLILEDRVQRSLLASKPKHSTIENRSVLDRSSISIPGLNCIDDFSSYMTMRRTRDQVIDRFNDVVLPLLQNQDVDLICHSWGTVVAYEALRRLDRSHRSQFRVSNFFTVGSALSINAVCASLETNDRRKPRVVNNWVNVDCAGDPVGGSLLDQRFDVDHEFVNLEPTNCSSFLGIFSPTCAHSSYFHPSNREVNRDVFARFIER